jgi:hypothetical protein
MQRPPIGLEQKRPVQQSEDITQSAPSCPQLAWAAVVDTTMLATNAAAPNPSRPAISRRLLAVFISGGSAMASVSNCDFVSWCSASQTARSSSPSAAAIPGDGRLAVALPPNLCRERVQATRGVAGAVIDQRFAVDLGHDQALGFGLRHQVRRHRKIPLR